MIIEASVDAFEDALAAEAEGVDRIELCGPLHDGGTTPDLALVARVLAHVRAPVHVLIRSRAGDFVYDDRDIAMMAESIRAMRALGAAGIVVGAITEDGDIDTRAMHEWISTSGSLTVGMHRAFDCVADPFSALDWLAAHEVSSVLTSGAAPTALEGLERLRSLVNAAGDRLAILAAGSITPANVRTIVAATGVTHVHGRAFRGLRAALTPTP